MEELENKQELNEQSSQEQVETPQEEAGVLGIIASILFPLIGVIIYFVQRKAVKNPNAYLWGALAGFAVGLLLRAIAAA